MVRLFSVNNDNILCCAYALNFILEILMKLLFHLFSLMFFLEEFWFLILGSVSSPPIFHDIVRQSSMLLQGFFMPLFFFISAYFVPTSYHRKGSSSNSSTTVNHEFFKSKTKRLYYPAMTIMMTLVPLCIVIGRAVSQENTNLYVPIPAHCWFNLWLLALYWVYSTLVDTTPTAPNNITHPKQQKQQQDMIRDQNSSTISQPTIPFPSTWKRMTTSAFICGVLMLVSVALTGPVSFSSMPMLNGALTCDLYMFTMGIWARQYGWLENNLSCQMDLSPWVLRFIVLLEATIMVTLYQLFDITTGQNLVAVVIFFIISGMYTVDMSLALLQIFQETKWLCQETKWTKFFSSAAYTVYLIHPLIVVVVSTIYAKSFNALVTEEDQIVFPKDERPPDKFLGIFAVPGQGGEEYYVVGWLIINILSHIIVWPLAWCVAKLPYLRTIL